MTCLRPEPVLVIWAIFGLPFIWNRIKNIKYPSSFPVSWSVMPGKAPAYCLSLWYQFDVVLTWCLGNGCPAAVAADIIAAYCSGVGRCDGIGSLFGRLAGGARVAVSEMSKIRNRNPCPFISINNELNDRRTHLIPILHSYHLFEVFASMSVEMSDQLGPWLRPLRLCLVYVRISNCRRLPSVVLGKQQRRAVAFCLSVSTSTIPIRLVRDFLSDLRF